MKKAKTVLFSLLILMFVLAFSSCAVSQSEGQETDSAVIAQSQESSENNQQPDETENKAPDSAPPVDISPVEDSEKDTNNDTQESPASTENEPQQSENDNEPSDPDFSDSKPESDVSSAEIYKPVIENFGKDYAERFTDMGYEIEAPEYEYAVKDINSDGVDELVIHIISEDSDGRVAAIYTLDEDQPLQLYFQERHGSYKISADGYFIFDYNFVSIEKLSGTELILIDESDSRNWEDFEKDKDAFLSANNVSTELMAFDYIPYQN